MSMADRLGNLRNSLSIGAGPSGKLAVARLIAAGRRGSSTEPRRIPVTRFGDVWMRPGSTDLSNSAAYFGLDLFEPPPELRGKDLSLLCELGSNMGGCLVGLATTYPGARVLGVEPDPENAETARRNTERFGERVRVEQAAVWDQPGSVGVDRGTGRGEHGIVIRESSGADVTVPARTIDELLESFAPGEIFDYIHVTMEGSEERVFAAGGEWPKRVRSMRVEAHPYYDYPIERCIEQMEALGFRAWAETEPPDKWVYAVRDELLGESSSQTAS